MADIYDYSALLEEAYAQMPEKLMHRERFEIPKVDVLIEGNKTIFRNFKRMAEVFNRDLEFFSKFLSNELASPVRIDGERLIIQRRVLPDFLQKKVEKFATLYVICKECKRPDTTLIMHRGYKEIVCNACGARRVVK